MDEINGNLELGNGNSAGSGDESTDKKPARDKCHWTEWEIGLLIARTDEGTPIVAIAEHLYRSPRGCKNELDRLIADAKRTNCPPGSRAALDRLTERRAAALCTKQAAPAPGGVGGGYGKKAYDRMLDAVREQYKALGGNITETAKRMAEVEKLMSYSLAIDVVGGHIGEAEIREFCDPLDAYRIAAIAKRITAFRRGDLCQKPPIDKPMQVPLPVEMPPVPAGSA